MSAVNVTLSKDDQTRINNNSEYKEAKRVLATREYLKEFEVGTAVLIKHKASGNFIANGSWYNSDNQPPSKFLIIHNDDGFVFVKRIISSGKPGKLVECLTTDYTSDLYEIVMDEDYADAVLLDEEYDPAATAKEQKRKKSKASRENNKIRLKFDEPIDAYNYLSKLKKGDSLYETWTTFGDNLTEYRVKKVQTFALKADTGSRWNGCRDSERHRNAGFSIGIKVILEDVNANKGYYYRDPEIQFYNICSHEDYKHSNKMIYPQRPMTPEDVA